MRLAAAMRRHGSRFLPGMTGMIGSNSGGRGVQPRARRSVSRGVTRPVVLLNALVFLACAPVVAQELAPASPPAPPKAPLPPPVAQLSTQQLQRIKYNQDTLIVAASRPGGAYLTMASDLSASMGAGGSVRLLPLASDGGIANLRDVLLLRGIDMALVPANVLAHAKATNALGSGLAQRISYITALYSEEVHIVAGQEIATITDLNGKRVAVAADDATARLAASDLFHRLGVGVETVPMEPAGALDEVRNGTVAAVLLIGGKPLTQVQALPKDGSMRLLSLGSLSSAGEGYAPAVLLADDYPALIPPGAIVETVAVSAVLVAGKGGDETPRIARHTPAVLEAIARLALSQRHPKWRDVNLGAALPGWTRVEAAETWLHRAIAEHKAQSQESSDEPSHAERKSKPADAPARPRKGLYDEYELWARQSATSVSAK